MDQIRYLYTMDMTSFPRFDSSCQAVLSYLHQRLGFSLWMMTRVTENDWVILHVKDHAYSLKAGMVLRWTDSFCSRMVEGYGPRVAPSSALVPAYVEAPIGQQLPIGSYIGVPVSNVDGSLFGTLCAIDPDSQDDSVCDQLPLVELYAELLGSVLNSEQTANEQTSYIDGLKLEASTDALTGLLSRNGWESALSHEEARTHRYGYSVSVFIIDIDGLKMVNDDRGHAEGDELIRKMAECLRSTLRDSDIVSRIGGDEFAVLALECGDSSVEKLRSKIKNSFLLYQLNASIGCAAHDPENDLRITIAQADSDMYADKATHKKYH